MTDPIRTTFEPLDINIHATVVPYTRMTQKSKFVDPSAIRYMDSQKELKILMSIANHSREYYQDYLVPEKAQFCVRVAFYVNSLHKCDLDNLVKAVLDAGQGILYRDDRYCDRVWADRIKVEHEPYIHLRIYPIAEETK